MTDKQISRVAEAIGVEMQRQGVGPYWFTDNDHSSVSVDGILNLLRIASAAIDAATEG